MTKKRILWTVKILISIVIIAVLVNTIRLDKIFDALKNAEKDWVLLAVILLPLNIALQFAKWRLLLSTLKEKVPFWEVLSSLLVGFTLGLATPGRMGEVGRAFAVRNSEPLAVMGLSLADKFYNLACIALFGGMAIITLPGLLGEWSTMLKISTGIAYIIGAFIILFLAIHPGFVRGILYSISLMLPKRDKMKALTNCLDGITRKRAMLVLFLSMLFYATFVVQFFALANAFSELKFIDGIRGLPAIVFTKTFVPISIGGLGIGELASVQFLSMFRVEAVSAFNASLILFTINVLFPGILGFAFIPKLKFTRNSNAGR